MIQFIRISIFQFLQFLCTLFLLCFCASSSTFRLLDVFSFLFFFGSIKSLQLLEAACSTSGIKTESGLKKKMGWFSLFAFFLSLPPLLWLVNLSLGIIFWLVPTLCLFNALQNTPALLVSLAAVFWMSRSRSFGGTLRDIQKTGARETMLLCIIPSSLISWACRIVWPSMCTTFLTSCLALDITSTWYFDGLLRWVSEVFLASGGNFRCWPKADTSSGHYKDLTETGNRARKVSGTQGNVGYE